LPDVRRDRKHRRPRSIVITVTRADVLASARCTDCFAASLFPDPKKPPQRGDELSVNVEGHGLRDVINDAMEPFGVADGRAERIVITGANIRFPP
jgi:hypothetical protein